MYEMFAGAAPFTGRDPMDAAARWDCTPLEQMGTALDDGMGELVQRLLSEEPDDRPSSAAAALAQLRMISIRKRPLGLDFGRQLPLTVRRVGP